MLSQHAQSLRCYSTRSTTTPRVNQRPDWHFHLCDGQCAAQPTVEPHQSHYLWVQVLSSRIYRHSGYECLGYLLVKKLSASQAGVCLQLQAKDREL